MSSWVQTPISLRYPLRGALYYPYLFLPLYFLLLPQNIVLNWTYLLYFTSYSFRLNHFHNSLIPKLLVDFVVFWRILKKLANCIREYTLYSPPQPTVWCVWYHLWAGCVDVLSREAVEQVLREHRQRVVTTESLKH